MMKSKAQSTLEFVFALIAVMFLTYGMVQVFRWAGMDLANRRVLQDSAITYLDGTTDEATGQLTNTSGSYVLPISAIYRGSITNKAGQ